MVSLLAASLCLVVQTPPTIEELRKHMADDMRKLTSYSDEWKIVMPKEAGSSDIGFRRYIDGPRSELTVLIDGKVLLESGYDGKNSWVVSHPAKLFADEPMANLTFDKKDLGPPKDAEDGSFQFTFSGPYDFSIWAKPDLKVTGMEKVKLRDLDARKITAAASRPTGKIEVEMWFDMNRWRMIKAHAHGGKTGEETEVFLNMVKSNAAEKFGSSSFMLEQSKVSGYAKKTFDELKSDGDLNGGGTIRL